jgi:hypothetical protein
MLSLVACADNDTAADDLQEQARAASRMDISQVIAVHVDKLMMLDDVVAVGQGRCDDQDCIRVLLSSNNTETLEALPRELSGYPVVAEISGPVTANPK